MDTDQKGGQRFSDINIDATYEVSEEDLYKIRDSMNHGGYNGYPPNGPHPNADHTGFLALPTRVPLGAIIIFVVQCVSMAIAVTSIYVEQKTTTSILSEKITKLESTCYTKTEAVFLEKELIDIKQQKSN